jgi:hypothetical protein
MLLLSVVLAPTLSSTAVVFFFALKPVVDTSRNGGVNKSTDVVPEIEVQLSIASFNALSAPSDAALVVTHVSTAFPTVETVAGASQNGGENKSAEVLMEIAFNCIVDTFICTIRYNSITDN